MLVVNIQESISKAVTKLRKDPEESSKIQEPSSLLPPLQEHQHRTVQLEDQPSSKNKTWLRNCKVHVD